MFGILNATAILAAVMIGGSASAPPIDLIVEPHGEGVRLRVVGEAKRPMNASYSLEVIGGEAGTNRSVQRGTARLSPGETTTLVTLTLGNAHHWAARLEVSPENGKPYELRESSGAVSSHETN